MAKNQADQKKDFQKKMEGKAKAVKQPKQDYEQIVRLLNTDLDGRKSILSGLRRIKGISFAMSNIILKKTAISPSIKTSDLTDEQTSAIENAVKDPSTIGIPTHMLNVRRHVDDNDSRHLTGSDLDIFLRNHIAEVKKLGSYIGIRHRTGKRVRGQRTRSTGRGSGAVGVSKKKK